MVSRININDGIKQKSFCPEEIGIVLILATRKNTDMTWTESSSTNSVEINEISH